MKTAVSVPDELFEAAERQLHSEALAEHLARHAPDEVTEAMNAVVDQLQAPTAPFVMAASQRALRRSEGSTRRSSRSTWAGCHDASSSWCCVGSTWCTGDEPSSAAQPA